MAEAVGLSGSGEGGRGRYALTDFTALVCVQAINFAPSEPFGKLSIINYCFQWCQRALRSKRVYKIMNYFMTFIITDWGRQFQVLQVWRENVCLFLSHL